MKKKQKRKNQPEQVRRLLLDAAGHIAAEKGLPAITLDLVASQAGFSKGGLLHHFPSRQALVEALYQDILGDLDRRIQEFMTADPEERGRFSRAYVLAVTAVSDRHSAGRLLGAAALAATQEVEAAALWRDWLSDRLTELAGQENALAGQVVRYAADGLWLADCTGLALPPEERAGIVARLVKLTHAL